MMTCGRVPWIAGFVLCLIVATAGAGFAACGGSSAGPTGSPSANPSTSASPTSAPLTRLAVRGSLLVVRKDGPDRWAVWRVTPGDASQTRICALPFRPTSATVSPSGARVAYLSYYSNTGAHIVVVDAGARTARDVSLTGHKVKTVGQITWVSDTTLLVAANASLGSYSATDRLYTVSANTGRVSAFGGIVGTEPSAAPGADRLVYVMLKEVQRATVVNGYLVILHEEVILAGLRPTGPGRVILTSTYEAPAARQDFNFPLLSPNGRLLLTAETGSDVSTRYQLRDLQGTLYFSRLAPNNFTAAWSQDSRMIAMGSMRLASDAAEGTAVVWIYHADSRHLTKLLPGGRLSNTYVYPTSLGWSRWGDLVIGLMGSGRHAPQVLVAPKGKQSGLTSVTTGSLPVWVK
jgi:hypothetical protein